MIKEADIARAVIDWLQEQQWDVYQEVRPMRGDPIADIVAVQNRRVWIIECKAALSLAVMEQAQKWQGLAHWVSCAVAHARHSQTKGRNFAWQILQRFGVGLLYVSNGSNLYVDEKIEPILFRRAQTDAISESLVPEHKTAAMAGTNKGGYWTPFKDTCRQLAAYVSQHPGCTLKSAVENIKHHYHASRTAASCLAAWIRHGKVPGIGWVDDDPRKGLCYRQTTT